MLTLRFSTASQKVELPDNMYVVIPSGRPARVSYEITNIGASKAFKIELNDTYSQDNFQVTPIGVPFSACDGSNAAGKFQTSEADGAKVDVYCNGTVTIAWTSLESRALSVASIEVTPLSAGWMEPQRAEVWYDVKEAGAVGAVDGVGDDSAVMARSSSGGRVRVMTSDEMLRATGKLWPSWGMVTVGMALMLGTAVT